MALFETLRAWRRRRRERAGKTLVAARLPEKREPPSLTEDAERLRAETRRNTMIPPSL